MTSRNYFGEMNSTLGSVVPLAMFNVKVLRRSNLMFVYIEKFATREIWSEGKIIFGKSPSPMSSAGGTSRTA